MNSYMNEVEIPRAIEQEALNNDNIYVVCADGLQKQFFPKLWAQYPNRVILCGISEQNQVSIANGLALGGKKVYCIMMSAFFVHRALDQIKMASYSNCDIKFLGAASDLGIMVGGYSHIAIDDISILKNTPNLEIYTPYTRGESEYVIKESLKKNTPMFISLSYSGGYIAENNKYEEGFSTLLKGFDDCCIITTGNAINTLVYGSILKNLAKKGFLPTVISSYKASPVNEEACNKIISKYKKIITFEHRGSGSLSSTFGEIIAKSGKKVDFMPIYLKDKTYNVVGGADYVASKYLDFENLPSKIAKFIEPREIFLFNRKGKVGDDLNYVKIKRKFMGITYYKQKITNNERKSYLLGFIPTKPRSSHPMAICVGGGGGKTRPK